MRPNGGEYEGKGSTDYLYTDTKKELWLNRLKATQQTFKMKRESRHTHISDLFFSVVNPWRYPWAFNALLT